MSLSKYDPAITIESLCHDPEGQYFDRKSARLQPKDLAHHISAFANANGGTIVLGIEDRDEHEITGLDIRPNAENDFRQAPYDYLECVPEMTIEIITAGADKKIMLVFVKPSYNRVIRLKNQDTYLRIGDQSRKLGYDEILKLEYDRGIRSYEDQIAQEATFDDLDMSIVKEYMDCVGTTQSNGLDLLKARGSIRIRGDQIAITNAGILLFGKHPTEFLPNARVRFLRYEGTEEGVGTELNIVKDISLECALPILLKKMKDILSAQMREFQTLDESGRFTHYPEYPEFAWLEGLVNAVTHRDYSIRGDYVRIKMFDDRIEFISPGKLPNIVTIENIRTTRYSRNPIIARILTDFGWVRELNEGVKRIYVDMEKLFLEPPIYTEPHGNVQLVLKNNIAMRSMRQIEKVMEKVSTERWMELDALERIIVMCIANIEKCTMKDLVRYTEKSRVTIQNRLKKLVPDIVTEHKTSPQDPTKYYTL